MIENRPDEFQKMREAFAAQSAQERADFDKAADFSPTNLSNPQPSEAHIEPPSFDPRSLPDIDLDDQDEVNAVEPVLPEDIASEPTISAAQTTVPSTEAIPPFLTASTETKSTNTEAKSAKHIKPSDLPPEQKEALIAANLANNESTFFTDLIVIATGNHKGRRLEKGEIESLDKNVPKAIAVIEEVADTRANYTMDQLVTNTGYTAFLVEETRAKRIRDAFEKRMKKTAKEGSEHKSERAGKGGLAFIRKAFFKQSDDTGANTTHSRGIDVDQHSTQGAEPIPPEPLDK